MMNRKEIFKKIARLLKSQGAKKIAVFGSYVRGEEKPGSDIDIIVEFSERKSLLEFVRIERELTEVLGIKVDLLTEKSISPYLIDPIRKDMAGMKDKLIHDYLGVDIDAVWDTVEEDIPTLKNRLKYLIKKEENA